MSDDSGEENNARRSSNRFGSEQLTQPLLEDEDHSPNGRINEDEQEARELFADDPDFDQQPFEIDEEIPDEPPIHNLPEEQHPANNLQADELHNDLL